MNKFYSHQGEDKFIYEYIYKKNPPLYGKYIEIGAMDGVIHSNTKFFSDNFNWNGVLIEPVLSQYSGLVKNRPNDECFNFAIAKEVGEVDFLGTDNAEGESAVAARLDVMTPGFKAAWHRNNKPYKVKSCPISQLVFFEKYPKIDFFSLDVEGSELDVLETFDWRIHVNLIMIEINAENETNENNKWGEYFNLELSKKCRKLLKEKEFNFMQRIGGNDIWINKKWLN